MSRKNFGAKPLTYPQPVFILQHMMRMVMQILIIAERLIHYLKAVDSDLVIQLITFLTYKNMFAGHTIDVMVGTSWMREYYRTMGIGSGSTDLGGPNTYYF